MLRNSDQATAHVDVAHSVCHQSLPYKRKISKVFSTASKSVRGIGDPPSIHPARYPHPQPHWLLDAAQLFRLAQMAVQSAA